MPIYCYECQNCKKRFDKLVPSFREADSVTSCPVCGKEGGVKRIWHTVGSPIFRGTGFYSTDYKNKQG